VLLRIVGTLLIACCAWRIGLCVLTCVPLVITTMYYIHFQTAYIPNFNMATTMACFFLSHLSWLHHRGEGRRDQSGVGKMSLLSMGHSSHSSTNATHPRCSGRAGTRMGGHTAQLERIGTQLEASQHVSRPLMTFPNDAAENPVAPPPGKAGIR